MRTIIGIGLVVLGTVGATALTIALVLLVNSDKDEEGQARIVPETATPPTATEPAARGSEKCTPRTCSCHPLIFQASAEYRNDVVIAMGGVQSYYYLHDHPNEIPYCDIISGDYLPYNVSATQNGVNEISFSDQLSGTDGLGVTIHYPTGEVDIDILRNADALGYKMFCVVEHELAHAVGYEHSDPIFQEYHLETCVCHYNEVGYCDRVQ